MDLPGKGCANASREPRRAPARARACCSPVFIVLVLIVPWPSTSSSRRPNERRSRMGGVRAVLRLLHPAGGRRPPGLVADPADFIPIVNLVVFIIVDERPGEELREGRRLHCRADLLVLDLPAMILGFGSAAVPGPPSVGGAAVAGTTTTAATHGAVARSTVRGRPHRLGLPADGGHDASAGPASARSGDRPPSRPESRDRVRRRARVRTHRGRRRRGEVRRAQAADRHARPRRLEGRARDRLAVAEGRRRGAAHEQRGDRQRPRARGDRPRDHQPQAPHRRP